TLIDETAGISVFNLNNTFGYTVTQGDEVTVNGVIDQFNGLTQIIADTVMFNSGGNDLKIPTTVSEFTEAIESDLIFTETLFLVDETQWLGDGTSFNVEITDELNIYIMRIDNNTELASLPVTWITDQIGENFDLRGIGTQFDSDSPYTDGYQIMPRNTLDFDFPHSIQEVNFTQIKFYPNPTIDNLIINAKENIESLEIINQLGEVVDVVTINALQKTINVQHLPAGYYFMKLKTARGLYSADFIKY
ncbi:MAG: T9SS type A sorting domain-containing protein, partial [Chitinophagales bacterium]|nr:T9SS type A sorting domain-containing protein [Chitinophagales bacterium]